jgi:hypothetical protein
MHLTPLYASSLALLPVLVAGHGGIPGAPRIFGLPPGSDLDLREAFASVSNVQKSASVESGHLLSKRQRKAEQTCGPNIGSCEVGLCCSADGICDDSKDSCAAPDCKFEHGPACDANALPGGTSTSSVARPHIGNIPYGGEGVRSCRVSRLHCLTTITKYCIFRSPAP